MNNIELSEKLKKVTQDFSLRAIKRNKAMSGTVDGQVIGKQLLRTGTSVASNHQAACRAKSQAEFHSKMSIEVKEADETIFWIGLIASVGIVLSKLVESILSEVNEILLIAAKARKKPQKTNLP